jgi:hypothetical protein
VHTGGQDSTGIVLKEIHERMQTGLNYQRSEVLTMVNIKTAISEI